MVGFSSSLRIARRPGWEDAYLDYETLKLLLSQIESVYEEEGHRRCNNYDNSPPSNRNSDAAHRISGDYRDELFLESDSDLAFASSASEESNMHFDDEYANANRATRAAEYDLEQQNRRGAQLPTKHGHGHKDIHKDMHKDIHKDIHKRDETGSNPVPLNNTRGGQGPSGPFTMTYSDEQSSSGEDNACESALDMGKVVSECAGETITRAFSFSRGEKNNAIQSTRTKKKKSKSQSKNSSHARADGRLKPKLPKNGDGATEFFVGNFMLETNGGIDNVTGDVALPSLNPSSTNSPDHASYSSSLLNTSFQRGFPGEVGSGSASEQTSLLQPYQFAPTLSSVSKDVSLSPSRYHFPASSGMAISGEPGTITSPTNDSSGDFRGASWPKWGENVDAFPTRTASASQQQQQQQQRQAPDGATTHPRLSAAETWKQKRFEEIRKEKQQRWRRRVAKRREEMERKVPRHLRVAHGKARAITERFLGLLRAEVEKVTLFAQARLGELADTAGSLRFPPYENGDSGGGGGSEYQYNNDGAGFTYINRPSRVDEDQYDVLAEAGMHPSASSSDDERGGPFSWSDSSDDDNKSEAKPNSPTFASAEAMRTSYSEDGLSATLKHQRNLSNKNSIRDTKLAQQGRINHANPSQKKDAKKNAAKRQIQHFEQLRRSRPIFQRNDHIVGEDVLLLSAVDEADGYTAVGVELMHVLHFISVNVIALRKICRKHDRLLANRMLGGYYHRRHRKRYDSRTKAPQQPFTLEGIISNNVGRNEDGLKSSGEEVSRAEDKLVGNYDAKIQRLANSTTVQVISSCLALALSEYEVSQSRADALAQLNSATAAAAPTPLRGGATRSVQPTATGVFALSPPRWISQGQGREMEETGTFSFDETLDSNDESGPLSTASNVSLIRLRFTVVSIFGLREAARIKDTSTHFLSRSFLAFTGQPNDGLDGCSRETLDFFVKYNPDAALVLDSFTLFSGLGEGHSRQSSTSNVMLSSLVTPISAARSLSSRKLASLTEDRDFVKSALSMSLETKEFKTKATSCSSDSAKTYSTALELNSKSLLLYTMNYYIIFPTAAAFAADVGVHPAYCATLIGATSFGGIFAGVFHVYLLSKNLVVGNKGHQSYKLSSFRGPLLLASFFPIVGNTIYALAVYRNSLQLAMIGRLLVGLGSAEIIHREILSNCLPAVQLVAESFRILKYQLKGLTAGILIGALLSALDGNLFVFDRPIDLPSYGSSWLMSLLWFLHWGRLFLNFKDPANSLQDPLGQSLVLKGYEEACGNYSSSDSSTNEPISNTPDSIFYRSASDATNDEINTRYRALSAIREKFARKNMPSIEHRESFLSTSLRDSKRRRNLGWKALLGRFRKVFTYNVALPVNFALLLFVTVAHEILFASCSVITSRYFNWGGGLAGLFLGVLSAFLLPVNTLCEDLSRTYEERTIVKGLFNVASHVDVLLVVDTSASASDIYDWSFGLYQYTIGFILTFAGLGALQGTTLSLLSKVAPQQSSFISCGTIVTFLNLFGRCFANLFFLMISLSHRFINIDSMNSLVIPLIIACIAARYIVKKHFFFLM